ncbi:MAG: hypothetical protein PV340_03310 [Wolbachia sp.]|nr:hypothetical protein [Wolbachia sp.]
MHNILTYKLIMMILNNRTENNNQEYLAYFQAIDKFLNRLNLEEEKKRLLEFHMKKLLVEFLF